MSASEGGLSQSESLPPRKSKLTEVQKKPAIITFDYATGLNNLHTVDGSDPSDRVRMHQIDILAATDLSLATLPNREDLQDVVFVEFDEK